MSTKLSDGCFSTISSEHKVSPFELATEAERSPITGSCNIRAKASFNRCSTGEEALISDVDRDFNDNCSSSKPNSELNSASLEIDLGELSECSSSRILIAEKASHQISERDTCISVTSSDNYCSKPCKVCGDLDSTLNMIICDNCADAYHISCCNPNITSIPVGEWLCSACMRKKSKVYKEKSTNNSVSINSLIGRNGNSALVGNLGSIEFMFSETEPYMSSVRLGDEFQANVPDWSGSIVDEAGPIVDRLETDPSNNVSTQNRISNKHSKLGSIGNWLQCQEFVEGIGEGVEGIICGKWRRAPIFEVQTDYWECFDCVHWDPSHADCAVPQEVDTEEVMKQLKYIEMLRPQVAAKRRKLKCSKSK
ncbi:hypothetical protein BUALT_Bualt09G0058100 [Buddleja alternifolia]|uniref:Uncharacterized protein n=1 Tax=Buddleja alternifolia TaxID=168488 RepID=A0AAV6X0V8_9LAMI|nr:hypothetical protein BUALT_Bualt09G0058100 [Buddleja alternifolia]